MPTHQTEPADAGTTPTGSAAERRHFVASKLAAPPLRSGIVDRPVLVDKLISVPDVPVVLVSAPRPVEVSAGSSSSDIRSRAMLTVIGDTRVISGEERAFLSVVTAGS